MRFSLVLAVAGIVTMALGAMPPDIVAQTSSSPSAGPDAPEVSSLGAEDAAPTPTPSPTPSTQPTPTPQTPSTPSAAAPEGGSAAGSPTASLPLNDGTAALQKVFNPDISAIGNFVGVAGKSPGGGESSLNLEEAEIGLQSIVDPYARADFFLTFGSEEVGVEEGYVTFLALPGSLLMKVGKMRDAFGKVDAMHCHVLPTADRPLVSQNLLGGEDALADSGISMSRLIPIPGVFLEATGQVFRGESEVFKAPTRSNLAYVGHLRFYQDFSESSNIDLGGSVAYGHNGADADTTTRLIGADATFRYKPLRRAIYTHVLARAELVWSRREAVDAPTQNAFGGYAYLEYQFARRWFAGIRYDHSGRADDATLHDTGGAFVVTYWPSEFSQVRGQYRRTRFGEGHTTNELLFQFQFSIGAHGAHAF
jgi:hypothetical protein